MKLFTRLLLVLVIILLVINLVVYAIQEGDYHIKEPIRKGKGGKQMPDSAPWYWRLPYKVKVKSA